MYYLLFKTLNILWQGKIMKPKMFLQKTKSETKMTPESITIVKRHVMSNSMKKKKLRSEILSQMTSLIPLPTLLLSYHSPQVPLVFMMQQLP